MLIPSLNKLQHTRTCQFVIGNLLIAFLGTCLRVKHGRLSRCENLDRVSAEWISKWIYGWGKDDLIVDLGANTISKPMRKLIKICTFLWTPLQTGRWISERVSPGHCGEHFRFIEQIQNFKNRIHSFTFIYCMFIFIWYHNIYMCIVYAPRPLFRCRVRRRFRGCDDRQLIRTWKWNLKVINICEHK